MIKKLLLIIVALIVSISPLKAESEKVEVDITKLDQYELGLYQKLKQKQMKQEETVITPSKIAAYAEIGKSFGIAFTNCWGTVSKDVEKFANSSAGKWTMVLITWKIMGDDAIGVSKYLVKWAVCVPILISGVIFWIYIFRKNCIAHPIIAAVEKIGFWKTKITYSGSMKNPINYEGDLIVYYVALLGFIVLMMMIMFG